MMDFNALNLLFSSILLIFPLEEREVAKVYACNETVQSPGHLPLGASHFFYSLIRMFQIDPR